LELCNSIGSPLDTKHINFEPLYSTITKTHIIACSNDFVYVWQYRNQVARLTTFETSANSGVRKLGRDVAWYVDDVPDTNLMYDKETF
jgi:WD repeat-containing protein 35